MQHFFKRHSVDENSRVQCLWFFSTLEKHTIETRCDLSKAEVHLGEGHMGSKI